MHFTPEFVVCPSLYWFAKMTAYIRVPSVLIEKTEVVTIDYTLNFKQSSGRWIRTV